MAEKSGVDSAPCATAVSPVSRAEPCAPSGGEAAFFDLDKTVIAKASMLAFGPSLLEAGLLSRRLLARALWGQVVFRYLGADEARMQKMRETALKLSVGWDSERISTLVDNALTDVIDPIVYDEAVELIASHKACGRRVYLVSASPTEVVLPLARHLGVDDAIATRVRVDLAGRYTGEVEFYAAGPHKAEAMAAEAERHNLDLGRSFAYSDSFTDVPMLEAVGCPVAVNPDRALLSEAQSRGWEVRVFEHPRPLNRDRLPSTPKPRTFGLLAATGAAGAGFVLWRRSRRTRQMSRTLRARITPRTQRTTKRRSRLFDMRPR